MVIMSREEIKSKLQDIMRELFEDDTITISDKTVASDISGWDSFSHIDLITDIEHNFSIKIPIGKVLTMKNVGEMIDFISANK